MLCTEIGLSADEWKGGTGDAAAWNSPVQLNLSLSQSPNVSAFVPGPTCSSLPLSGFSHQEIVAICPTRKPSFFRAAGQGNFAEVRDLRRSDFGASHQPATEHESTSLRLNFANYILMSHLTRGPLQAFGPCPTHIRERSL